MARPSAHWVRSGHRILVGCDGAEGGRSLSRDRRRRAEGNPHAGSQSLKRFPSQGQPLLLCMTPRFDLPLTTRRAASLGMAFVPDQSNRWCSLRIASALARSVVAQASRKFACDSRVVGPVSTKKKVTAPTAWEIEIARPSAHFVRSGHRILVGCDGAEGGIRTHTPYGATPSRWCVCQFRHFRTGR